MASIYVYNIGSTSFSAQLIGLQTKDVDYTRKCQWNVRDKNNNSLYNKTEYITQGETEGVSHTITGLSSNATYSVSCIVYRMNDDNTTTHLADFAETVTTSSGGSGGDSGGDEEETWTIYNQGSKTSCSTDINTQMIFTQYRICKYTISFAYSGTATFYTSNSAVDTYVYLTQASNDNYIKVNGQPPSSDILAESDESTITYQVTAGTTYYVWVRDYYGTNTGSAILNITVPKQKSWSVTDKGSFDIADSPSVYISSGKRLYRYSTEVDENGEMTVMVTNPNAESVCLYVTTGTFWDETTGIPYDIIAEDKDNKVAVGVKFTASAYTTYYIWFGVTTDTVKAGATFYLMCSLEAPTIARWDWDSSNGDNTLSSSQTIDAHNALTGTGIERNTRNFPHEVWDDMVDKVKDISDEVVGWWDSASYGLSYANTKAIANSNGEYVLTANMFNTLRNNLEIAGISEKIGLSKIPNSSIPHPVYAGGTVYGDYFLTLIDYMNDCIDIINSL